MTTLARLKDKTTAVLALNFDSPKDEYLYEIKRLKSLQILLEMRQKQVLLSVNSSILVENFVKQADPLIKRALASAEQVQYPQAIDLLEQANEQLKRALRSTGVSIF